MEAAGFSEMPAHVYQTTHAALFIVITTGTSSLLWFVKIRQLIQSYEEW